MKRIFRIQFFKIVFYSSRPSGTDTKIQKIVINKKTSWYDLPILEKSDLQKPLQNRLSTKYNLKKVFKNKTSGSTGNPFYFAKDKFSHSLTWAIIYDRFGRHNLFGKKQARFYGMPKDSIARIKEKTKDFFTENFDISTCEFTRYLVQLSVVPCCT